MRWMLVRMGCVCSVIHDLCICNRLKVCIAIILNIYILYTFLFLQENPSEEDAAIVDKVLSMRLTKKEVCLFYLHLCSNAVS